jgi:pimeloyl-ACP methyl ester carboxylesterase
VGKDCQLAQYASPGVWNYLAKLMKISAPQVKTNSCQNAPVASGAHPLIVFTHGYTGTFTDYTFLFEDLASRGYVVASVNHTLEARATEFPDGRLVKSVVGTHFEDEMNLSADAMSQAVAVRLADLKFVMDELGRLNANRNGPFAGRLDMRRAALAGHSLGGMTALLGLKMEPRFRTAISIDGVPPGPLFGSTQKPVLILISGHDVDQDTCRLWTGLHGPRLALNFKGSEHLTPSDAVWLAPGAVKTGTAGLEATVAAMRDHIAAFLDANLKGDATDQHLTESSADDTDVEVTTRTQSLCKGLQKNAQE